MKIQKQMGGPSITLKLCCSLGFDFRSFFMHFTFLIMQTLYKRIKDKVLGHFKSSAVAEHILSPFQSTPSPGGSPAFQLSDQ